MAQTILIKRSNTSGAVPTTSQLSVGELALNTRDGKIYMRKYVDGTTGNDTITLIGDTSTFTATTLTGNLSMGDNVRAIFGTGNDLQIYHDGSHSFIRDSGTGHLKIQATNLKLQDASGNNYIDMIDGSYVRLMHNTATKLETTSTGIDVTGVITTDGLTTSADINFGDNDKAIFGAGSDLQIYHSGTQSFITENGTGDLNIQGNNLVLEDPSGNNYLFATSGGAVSLFHNASSKLATTATGIDVTGTVTADGLDLGDASVLNVGTIALDTIKGDADDNTNITFAGSDTTTFTQGGTQRLAVNTSGINVTGTVTADGLTVDGTVDVNFGSDGSNIASLSGASAGRKLDIQSFAVGASAGAGYSINATSGQGELDFQTTGTSRLNIDAGGDISFYEDTGTTPKLTWSASGETLTFADNGKAVFGAGSDLQIYSDGASGIIQQVGTGILLLKGQDFYVQNDASENFIRAETDGAVRLYYNNLTRLDTTSTGIDVTGTVTADGLTVDAGGSRSYFNSSHIRLSDNYNLEWGGGTDYVRGSNASNYLLFATNSSEAMRIDAGGNVGIGTANPVNAKLEIESSTDQGLLIQLKNTDQDSNTYMRYKDWAGQYWDTGINWANNDYYLIYGGTTKARFTNAGGLDLYGSGNSILTLNIGTTAGNYSALNVGRTDGGGTAHITPAVTGGVPIAGTAGILLGSTNGSIPAVGIQTPNSSNGHIVFNPKGTEKVRITADGNVGIGTSSPAEKLDIQGGDLKIGTGFKITPLTSGAIGLNRDPDGGASYTSSLRRFQINGPFSGSDYLDFQSYNSSGAYQGSLVFQDGNVGIGTASPGHLLDILKTGSGDATINIKSTTGGDPTIIFNSAAANRNGLIKYQDNGTNVGRIEYVHNGDRIDFQAGSATSATMSVVNGKVGIGTTSPDQPLHVVGTRPLRLERSGVGEFEISIDNTVSGDSSDFVIEPVSGTNSAGFQVRTRNTAGSLIEALNVNHDGNVGIGGTSPTYKLVVSNGLAAGIEFGPEYATDTNLIQHYDRTASQYMDVNHIAQNHRFGRGAVEHMRINSTGNVGIGTTAPSGILSIPSTDTTTKPQIRFMTTGATNLADAALSTTDDSGGTNLLIGSNQYYSGASIARFDTSRSGTAIDFGYTGTMKFFTGSGNAAPTERMRIDSSGNLLVGQTTASSGTVGASLRSDGRNFFCADGNYSAHFNRKTSDGAIAHFAKDDTNVGSIGTVSGDLYIGTGDTTLKFEDGADRIVPRGTDGAQRDGAISLGSAGNRFNDLYLSGTVTSVGGVINTNTGANPLYVTRLGNTNESLKLYTDDRGVVFESIQDETADTYGNFIFIMDAEVTEPYFDVRKGAADSASIFHVDGGGNVGIGTTAPSAKLDLRGDMRLDGSAGTDRSIYFRNQGTVGGQVKSDTNLSLWAGNGSGTATQYLTVKEGGNVGIGTTTPQAQLQVRQLGINVNQSSVASTNQYTCDSMSATVFRSSRYTVQITNVTDSTYQITEILLIHDGTTPSITEYGTIFTGSAAEATFDADITSGNVRLLATPASTDSMQFKVVRHSILV